MTGNRLERLLGRSMESVSQTDMLITCGNFLLKLIGNSYYGICWRHILFFFFLVKLKASICCKLLPVPVMTVMNMTSNVVMSIYESIKHPREIPVMAIH